MARTSRRPMNRLLQEIDQGIQDYQEDAKERAARPRQRALLDILMAGKAAVQGIFCPRLPARAAADGLSAVVRPFSRPTLWS